jgi:hypothetical protein
MEMPEMTDRYLQPHQARQRPSTPYEDLLADSLERAFAQNLHEPAGIVGFLNEVGPPPQTAEQWTEPVFLEELRRLGE